MSVCDTRKDFLIILSEGHNAERGLSDRSRGHGSFFHAQPFPNLSGALRAAVARVVLHARALGERALCLACAWIMNYTEDRVGRWPTYAMGCEKGHRRQSR